MNGKKEKILPTLLMLWGLTPAVSHACQVIAPPNLYFFSSPKTHSVHQYTENPSPDSIQVSGCKQNKGFLMIGLSPNFLSLQGLSIGSYNGKIGDDHCAIKSNRLQSPERKFEAKRTDYENLNRFLTSCVVTTIEEEQGSVLRYPENQTGCSIEKISQSQIRFHGNYCFFQPSPRSVYRIHHDMDPSCADPDFLSAQGIRPSDSPAKIEYYMAGDSTGTSTDLQAKAIVEARFSINPSENFFPISEDIGDELPRWPAIWTPEIQFGSLRVKRSSSTMNEISLSFLADLNCESICQEGRCSSPCDFSAPLAAEASLYEKTADGVENYIDDWMTGGVLPAHWQGLLPTLPHLVPQEMLQVGKTYHLNILMRNPYDDFFEYLKALPQLLISTGVLDGRLAGADAITPLENLSPLRSIALLPSLPSLASAVTGSSDPSQSITDAINNLQRSLKSVIWPPEIEKHCTQDLKTCVSARSRFNHSFDLEFKIQSLENNQFQLYPLKLNTQSDLGEKTSITLTEPTVVTCP